MIFLADHPTLNFGEITGHDSAKYPIRTRGLVRACAHVANKVSGYRMSFSTRLISDPVDQWIANRSRNLSLGKEDGWISGAKSGLTR